MVEFAQSQTNPFFQSVGKAADIRRNWVTSEFRAMESRLEGLMEKETAPELGRWKPDLGDASLNG